MPSNKDRLYVALYARGGKPTMPMLEDTYHWALILGPKTERKNSKGRRFHAKEHMTLSGDPHTPSSVWQYEEVEISMVPTQMLLVRIMIGKVEDVAKLESVMRSTLLRPEVEGWNCVGWVKEAIETALQDSKALKTVNDLAWDQIRDTAMWYVAEKKAAHRFDGQGSYDNSKAATWDLLQKVEIEP